jgi:hypothetical protein
MNDYVHCLAVRDNRLYAGGFTTAGGFAAHYVEAWNGTGWSPLGSGTNGYVYALAEYDTALAVGGAFTEAGDKSSLHIALWTKQEPVTAAPHGLSAEWTGSAIELVWDLSVFIGRDHLVVERAGSDGEYRELGPDPLVFHGDLYRYRDGDVEPGTTYRYRVGLRRADGPPEWVLETSTVSVPDLAAALRIHPNPFAPATTIRYYLPEAGPVTLEVYAVDGRRVATLVDEIRQERGYRSVPWSGCDDRGKRVASGVYFCRLRTGQVGQTRKMVILR